MWDVREEPDHISFLLVLLVLLEFDFPVLPSLKHFICSKCYSRLFFLNFLLPYILKSKILQTIYIDYFKFCLRRLFYCILYSLFQLSSYIFLAHNILINFDYFEFGSIIDIFPVEHLKLLFFHKIHRFLNQICQQLLRDKLYYFNF